MAHPQAPDQLELFAAPESAPVRDVYVWAECVTCGDVWLHAMVTPGAWWAPPEPLSTLKYARYCDCGQQPPHLDAQRVAETQRTQGHLHFAV